MSQENVELVYRAKDAFNQRDLVATLALFDPDVEFIPRILEMEGGGPYRGHDGRPELVGELVRCLPRFPIGVAQFRERGRGPRSRRA